MRPVWTVVLATGTIEPQSMRIGPSGTSTSEQARPGLAERAAQVLQRIEESCRKAGRSSAEVKLVAVSKTMPDERVRQAAECGIRCLGENRPEALAARLANPLLQDLEIEWHLIGPLQSRKVRLVPACIGMIQSVDRLKTARLLSQLGQQLNRRLPLLLQVNPAQEASKQGLPLAEVEVMTIAMSALPGIEIQGLMAMTPYGSPEIALRRYFGDTRETMETLRARLPQIPWRHLSMGMSQDFEIAVEEGATIARVGTAIFGPRAVE